MFSNIILYIMLSSLFLLLTIMAWVILHNKNRHLAYRQQLNKHLHSLRLQKALKLFGIDSQHYLHSQPITDIKQHMQKCSNCDVIQQCDQQLEQSNHDEFIFCPNHEDLTQMKNSQASHD